MEVRPDAQTKKPSMKMEVTRKKHMDEIIDADGKKKSILVKTASKIELFSTKYPWDKCDLRHFLFHRWPDHGVPTGKQFDQLLDLVFEIDKLRQELDDCEVWVHWSVSLRFLYSSLTAILTRR